MADIFISYKREDKAIAETLASKLSALNYSVWWDHDLIAGEDYDVAIERKLKEAKCIIVLWTPLSVTSRNVKDEANIGLKREILIPLVFNNIEPPIGFRMVHSVLITRHNFSDGDEFAKIKESVLKKVNAPNIITTPDPKPSNSKRLIIYTSVLIAAILIFLFIKNTSKKQPEVSRNNDTSTTTLPIDTVVKVQQPDYSKFLKINIHPMDPRFTSAGEKLNWGGGSQSIFLACSSTTSFENCLDSIRKSPSENKVWETISTYGGVEILADAVYNPVGTQAKCIVQEWGVQLTEVSARPEGRFFNYGTGGAEGYSTYGEGIIKPKAGEYPISLWYSGNDEEPKKASKRNQYFNPFETILMDLVLSIDIKEKSQNDFIFSGKLQVYVKVNIDGNNYTIYSKESILLMLPSNHKMVTWNNMDWDVMESLRSNAYINK